MLGVNDTKDIGPQCPLVKTDETTLLARLGGGYCQAYPDLSDGKGIPEVLLGCQLEERLNRHNKVLGAVEYASDPADFGGHHRLRAKAAWEVLLDPDSRLSLRTSVVEAADYAPNGEQAKNLTCSLDWAGSSDEGSGNSGSVVRKLRQPGRRCFTPGQGASSVPRQPPYAGPGTYLTLSTSSS